MMTKILAALTIALLTAFVTPAFADDDGDDTATETSAPEAGNGGEDAQVEGWAPGNTPVVPHVIVVPNDAPAKEPPPSKAGPTIYVPVDGAGAGDREPPPTEADKK